MPFWIPGVPNPVLSPLSMSFRPLLSTSVVMYIRSDGNDGNSGFVNSASGAKATWTNAYTTMVGFDFNNQTVTFSNGNGASYSTGINMTQAWVGGGSIVYDLGGGTLTTSNAFKVDGFCLPSTITVQNGTLTGGFGIQHSAIGKVQVGTGMTFGPCTSRHIQATVPGANIEINFISYNISGGALSHMFAVDGGRIVCPGVNATFLASATFATTATEAFAAAKQGGMILAGAGTYAVGAFAVVGRRFSSQLNGYIDAVGGTLGTGSLTAYFPGDVAGVGTNQGASPFGLYNG